MSDFSDKDLKAMKSEYISIDQVHISQCYNVHTPSKPHCAISVPLPS